jgi:hypothetical protein
MSGGIASRPRARRTAPEPTPEPEIDEDEQFEEFDEFDDEEAVDEEAVDEEAVDERPGPDPFDEVDPEDHFVADDDAARGTTGDEARGTGD